MRVLSKDTFLRHHDGRTPMASFIVYTSSFGPDMLMRVYDSVGNDTWDQHFNRVSHDHGETWGEPRLVQRREPVEGGGHMQYGEAAALYHPAQHKLIIITNYGYEPAAETNSPDTVHRSHIIVAPPNALASATPLVTDFGFPEGFYMSFCHPIVDSRGRAIFPWQKPVVDGPGFPLQERGFVARASQPNVMADYWEAGVLIGEFDADGSLSWRVSQTQPFDIDMTSRGMCEPTVAELPDGRFAMICRGSNVVRSGIDWGPRPGYKWLSLSTDGAESWSKPAPLACDDGSLIESSATGSLLFRSISTGRLYWIGNLCLDGIPADGNHPRTPLVIAEMQEDPVAIKRETITVIDRRSPAETNLVQLSNFRIYQNRQGGDIVLFLNRFFERGGWEALGWHDTDLYRYRISLES